VASRPKRCKGSYAGAGSPEHHNILFVLDESSLATKNLYTFFSHLEAQDKVLLVGDIKQHQTVEAGSPLEQVQKHGVETAKLPQDRETERRTAAQSRKTPRRKSGQRAIDSLHKQVRIVEIADEGKRLLQIGLLTARDGENTLVISPANQERGWSMSIART
jgi:ATP-dependent exoDNAse (exonuclease V) alpha subunit